MRTCLSVTVSLYASFGLGSRSKKSRPCWMLSQIGPLPVNHMHNFYSRLSNAYCFLMRSFGDSIVTQDYRQHCIESMSFKHQHRKGRLVVLHLRWGHITISVLKRSSSVKNKIAAKAVAIPSVLAAATCDSPRLSSSRFWLRYLQRYPAIALAPSPL